MSNAPDETILALFRRDAEGQLLTLTNGLVALEAGDPSQLEALMRAAHSLKGAARIVGLSPVVHVAHALEDCFVAAQRGELELRPHHVDALLAGVDLLARISRASADELQGWTEIEPPEVGAFVNTLAASLAKQADDGQATVAPRHKPDDEPPLEPQAPGVRSPADTSLPAPHVPTESRATVAIAEPEPASAFESDRSARVSATHLNRLLALAGETLVTSRRWLPLGASLTRLKRLHDELGTAIGQLQGRLQSAASPEDIHTAIAAAQTRLGACRDLLGSRLLEFDTYERRATNLAQRLYGEALSVRMRPFGDAVAGLPRLARDVSRELGREVRLEILGADTQVDRDILEQIGAPLGHLIRNAIDHGIEAPADRVARGKSATGTVTVEARHSAGVLLIGVSDDGRGVDLQAIRDAVVRRQLATAETVKNLSDAELLEFLFLPGFSLRDTVTNISGRGVGLDAVQAMAKGVRGTARIAARPGGGLRVQLQLPLTLSVVRALLVEIAGEPYAIPLGFVTRTLTLAEADIASTEGWPHFDFEGRRTGLVAGHDVLGRPASPTRGSVPVVVLGEADRRYGIVVGRFLGEQELVVQPLDARLGKVKDIAAAALLEDGSPVLIIDAADFVQSVERLCAAGRTGPVHVRGDAPRGVTAKRVLVVDDSLTVREIERKLLESRGYKVETAVDGVDGWNAVRTAAFDLVVSDIDMPRIDGIELTRLIKQDARLRDVPVMIVSYKDRAEDRQRGLDAGADYYLTKASFHDETMLNAVVELIGDARQTTR